LNMSVAIKFENISKQYRLGNVGTGTLSHDLNRWWTINIRGKEDPYLKIGSVNDRGSKADSDYVWALRDINFEVQQGEVLGIIGKNGAGKSTLLKILSRVTTPTTGKIRAYGRIASLLEVGTGFHQEMTGRENIFMNGAILGMTKAEIRRKMDEIIDFAGVERYIDTPVKRYSSGMIVRLGFAVAAHLEPEILVVDEVLAVGDAEFQKKAIGKMQDISKGEGRTVLFVSHNMGSIQRLCKKGILLENGSIIYSGKIDNVVETYINTEILDGYFYRDKPLKNLYFIKKIELSTESGVKTSNFRHDESILINVEVTNHEVIGEVYLFITILDASKNKVFSAEKKIEKKLSFSLRIAPAFLTRGNYSLQAIIYKPAIAQYDLVEDTCGFSIIDTGSEFAHLETFDYGRVFGNYNWL